MGITERVSEGDGESPVTHAGLQTLAKSHTDPPCRSQALGHSGADMPVPLWAPGSLSCSP